MQSLVAYTNDPLDEEQVNSMWVAEDNNLSMTVKPECTVNANEEFLIAYSNEHWCQETFEYELLQRAVWMYRKDIDLSPNACWSRHSKAHALFNTEYKIQLHFAFTTCPYSVCGAAVPLSRTEPQMTACSIAKI